MMKYKDRATKLYDELGTKRCAYNKDFVEDFIKEWETTTKILRLRAAICKVDLSKIEIVEKAGKV